MHDDLVPEEREQVYNQLLALLRSSSQKQVPIEATEQAQIIARVRERLVQKDLGASLNGNLSVPQLGVLDSIPHQAESPAGKPRRDKRRLRLMALLAAVMIIMILLGAPLLLLRPWLLSAGGDNHSNNTPTGLPTLTLSTNVANVGQTVILHIRNFSSDTHVFLTHDIQEPLQLLAVGSGGLSTQGPTTASPLVAVGANGSADVTMVVDLSWTAGFHTIEAEDITTRYTASATLQIVGAGPTIPSRLTVSVSSLDLGADYQGANTIQSLTLQNYGGGSISWAASSNQPWLLISPPQGVFSKSQTISVAVERANLKPGDYTGMIAFSSNVGSIQTVPVHMTVRLLPTNSGPVLEVIPPLLSFTSLDGESNPPNQTLMISNPGSQQLNWSITGNNQALSSQNLLLLAFASNSNWLTTDQTAGMVVPHATSTINVMVNSQNLLPGVYIANLVFTSSQGTYNSPQSVSISLTVQPRCGLTLSAGSLSFTAVSGQTNPSNQSLNIGATSSCAGLINWKAASATNWLAVTPASGQLKGSASTVTSIGVNASILKPGTYVSDITFTVSDITFTASQSTQTVMVQLTVQPPPPPSAPILGATPLGLNFSATQGTPSPPGQVVTITNTGRSPLNWHTQVNLQVSAWLGAGPTGGTIPAGQTGQVTVNIDTTGLTPNTYVGQVVLIGTDASGKPASGSPQTITINLLVLPPCTLQQPSLSAIAFNPTQGTGDPGSQQVSITASGNCGWPLSWQAEVAGSPTWLKSTPAFGSLVASGQPTSITFAASTAGLTPGTYTAQVTITATDGSNTPIRGNSQTISVTLNVLALGQLQHLPWPQLGQMGPPM